MAAIVFATTASNGTTLDGWNPAVRSATDQATTGQTDWFWVPSWAQTLAVYFNLSAITGTSSKCECLLAYPATLDDGDSAVIFAGTQAAIAVTAASNHVYEFGPVLASAGTDSATADSLVIQNTDTPSVLGLKITNVVGGGAFSYTLAVRVQG